MSLIFWIQRLQPSHPRVSAGWVAWSQWHCRVEQWRRWLGARKRNSSGSLRKTVRLFVGLLWKERQNINNYKHMQSIMRQVSVVSTTYAKTYHEKKSSWKHLVDEERRNRVICLAVNQFMLTAEILHHLECRIRWKNSWSYDLQNKFNDLTIYNYCNSILKGHVYIFHLLEQLARIHKTTVSFFLIVSLFSFNKHNK